MPENRHGRRGFATISESRVVVGDVLDYEMSKNVFLVPSENSLEMQIYASLDDWDNDLTVEIPVQTMRDLVYGDSVDDVPGHVPVGPSRPTRDMKPLGGGRKVRR